MIAVVVLVLVTADGVVVLVLVTADVGVGVAITISVATAIVVPYTVTVSIVGIAVNTVAVTVGKTSVKVAAIERGIETDDITDEDKNGVNNVEGENTLTDDGASMSVTRKNINPPIAPFS